MAYLNKRPQAALAARVLLLQQHWKIQSDAYQYCVPHKTSLRLVPRDKEIEATIEYYLVPKKKHHITKSNKRKMKWNLRSKKDAEVIKIPKIIWQKNLDQKKLLPISGYHTTSIELGDQFYIAD